MRNFVILFFLLLAGFNHSNLAAEFNEEQHWEDMLYWAQSRSQWFEETCKELADETADAALRLKTAQKINPKQQLEEVSVSQGLSSLEQKRQRLKKFIGGVLNDLIYSSLCWNFFERTISTYSKTPSNTPEIRKAILPHLAAEFKNFEEYAIGDLKENPQNSYFSCEYFYVQAMLEDCELLAKHYGIAVVEQAQCIVEETKEPIKLTPGILLGDTVKFKGESVKTSKKLTYFMEQLVVYRESQVNSVNPTIRPDLTNPKLLAFQQYILSVSGPVRIEELPQTRSLETEVKKEAKLLEKKAHKKTKEKKVSGNKKLKSQRQEHKEKSTKPVPDVSRPLQHQPLEHPGLRDIAPAPYEDFIPQTHPLPSAAAASKSLVDSSPLTSPNLKPVMHPEPMPRIKLPMPQRINVRHIPLIFEHRYSTSYSFKGKSYPIPLFNNSRQHFDLGFLKTIKRMTHLSPKTDRLPNVAKGGIIIHYFAGDQDRVLSISFPDIFLSGGKFFGREDLEFKRKNQITIAMDLLTDKEYDIIKALPIGKKGIPLGIAMVRKLLENVGVACSSNNAHSEVFYWLTLKKQLPAILKQLLSDNPGKGITISGIVFPISSYRDCCSDCKMLTQGYQHALPHMILSLELPHLTLDANFSTLAMTSGFVRHVAEKYPQPLPTFVKGDASLESGFHKLICTYLK